MVEVVGRAEPFEQRVWALLVEFPEMPATVLAERVGWTGSLSWFRENVARLRPEHRRPDPADRLVWAPGDAAQCDLWFPPKRIPLEDDTTALLQVLVIVAAYSRWFFETSFMPVGMAGLILAVAAYVIARSAISRFRSRGIVDKVAYAAQPTVERLLD